MGCRNARRVVCTIRREIKMEVSVAQRFQAVYEDLIKVQQQRLYIDMDAKTLVCALEAAEKLMVMPGGSSPTMSSRCHSVR